MSDKSRQRQREANKDQTLRQRRGNLVLFSCLALCVLAGFAFFKSGQRHKKPGIAGPTVFKTPTSFAELCALPSEQLEQCDIAFMNLLCAEGLRGSEKLNVKECLARLDGIAKQVKFETDRHYYRFRQKPDEFNQSEGYYRMMMMATVIQQDFGIHYNPARVRLPFEPQETSEEFFSNSQDIFIHGLTREKGTGTCSSMPVFFVAVGRRLGYPLKLVRAKGHLFARWDEGQRSFNIEGTSVGFVAHPDEYYRSWPFPFTAEEEQAESYLKPLTPAQELATFLSIRGQCCFAATNWLYALGSFSQAYNREPQSVGNQKLFAWCERKVFEAGALPKRAALQFALRALELPDGPMRQQFAARKAALQAMNMVEVDTLQIETDLAALEAEIERYKTSRKAP